MGYLVERAALIDRLFKSLHLATARVPGALAVATIVTCAIFATATGIVGAVVTLMGLLAFPAMLKAGYNTKVAAGAITAGRLPRHPDPAVGAADRLRRGGGRVGRPALRRRLLSRHHARGAVHRLRHHAREAASPTSCRRCPRASGASRCRRSRERWRAQGSNALAGLWRAVAGDGSAGVREANRARAAVRHADAGAVRRRDAGRDLAARDRAGGDGRHGRAGRGRGLSATADAATSQSGRRHGAERRRGRRRTRRSRRPKPPKEARRRRAAGDAGDAGRGESGRREGARRRPPPRRSGCRRRPWFWIVLAVGIALLAVLYRSGTGSGSKCSRCC